MTEARTVYEDFIVANPKSKWRLQAEASMQALERQMRQQRAAAKLPAKAAGKE